MYLINRYSLLGILSLLFTFGITTNSFAFEQFFTSPGTRAMSMAGAFIAQADDSSAIWYNPAGLIQPEMPKFDITAEYGQVPQVNSDGDYGNGKSALKFASVGGNFNSGKSLDIGLGLSYFQPYRVSIYLPGQVNNMTVGQVNADYNQVSFAVAVGLAERFFIGGTVDKLLTSIDSTVDNYSYEGNGFSVGALYKVLDTEQVDLKAGAVYRSAVSLDAYEDYSEGTFGREVLDNIPSRPVSYGFGANVQVPVSIANINANANYEKIFWSEAFKSTPGLDYTKIAFGGELMFPLFETGVTSINLRTGWSEATPEDAESFETVNSVAFGLGTTLGQNLNLDFATENRELTLGENSDKFTFWSASLSYQF